MTASVQIAGYRIGQEIAHGGMGIVFRATHESTGREVAIKVLSESLKEDPQYHQYVERFLNEARAISVLNHPGIVHLIEHGQLANGTIHIIMEYLDGETLYSRLSRSSPSQGLYMPLPEVLELGMQIAAALSAAHSKSILHRDLKPSNVMLVPHPQDPSRDLVKVVDFGVARFLDTPHRRTTVGSVVGTPAYMSPEQCQGKEMGPQSDTYALGVLLYEMLCGQPPFDGTDMEVMVKHMTADPPPLRSRAPQVSESLAKLVHDTLAKHPRYRPTMDQVEQRLRAELAGPSPLLAPEAAPRSAAETPPIRWHRVAGICVVLFVMTGLLAAWLFQR